MYKPKPLVIIALGGIALSIASLAVAHGLVKDGWQIVADRLGDLPISVKQTACPKSSNQIDATPTQRALTWDNNGASLAIKIPIRLHYRPNGPMKIYAEGRADLLSHLRVDDGQIYYDCSVSDDDGNSVRPIPDITVSGIRIDDFELVGLGLLDMTDVEQPSLSIKVAGAGKIEGSGHTDSLAVSVAGAAKVDFGTLIARTADIKIAGAGDARLAVTESAAVKIAGAGQVHWTKRPPHLSSRIGGIGWVGDSEEE